MKAFDTSEPTFILFKLRIFSISTSSSMFAIVIRIVKGYGRSTFLIWELLDLLRVRVLVVGVIELIIEDYPSLLINFGIFLKRCDN